ncbi:MAG: transglycosylase SLT domain-containing protein [Alphaproteobacteria bacterium]|nr:transglycosylase SLT domain-containing protein [Alphaproteobacteria bacterium]
MPAKFLALLLLLAFPYTASADTFSEALARPVLSPLGKSALEKLEKKYKDTKFETAWVDIEDQEMQVRSFYTSSKKRNAATLRSMKGLRDEVDKRIANGQPTKALYLINGDKRFYAFDKVEQDEMKAYIAASYLAEDRAEKALKLATQALSRSDEKVPQAGWIAGLAAWRTERYRDAARYFEQAAKSPYASSWTISAAAYWAARAHLKFDDYETHIKMLQQAGQHPRTFYGMLALRSLGLDFAYNWELPLFTDAARSKLLGDKKTAALVYFLESGQEKLIEKSVRALPLTLEEGDAARILSALLHYRAYEMAYRYANRYAAEKNFYFDAALYPWTTWVKEDDFKVDTALVHGFMRQESRMDPNAKSGAGALGLLQLLPDTAKALDKTIKAEDLYKPAVNITLGQKYLQKLLDGGNVRGNLFDLAIAYNAGPGKLARWKDDLKAIDDPLLFIELIPSPESRAFIERVLRNYWIYRIRNNQPTITLDSVAGGNIPRYQAD